MADRLLVGVVVGAQGLQGTVRVKSFTERPRDLAAYGPLEDSSGRQIALTVTGEAKGVVLARAEGVRDRNAADAMKGTQLYVPRAALPAPEADEFYATDLVGLRAESPEGAPLGKVIAVHDFGAGELLEFQGTGASVMLPFTETLVPVVDLKAGRVVVIVPPDLVDDEGEDKDMHGEVEDDDIEDEGAEHARA